MCFDSDMQIPVPRNRFQSADHTFFYELGTTVRTLRLRLAEN